MEDANGSMDHVPEPRPSDPVAWIAYERDAAWAAKLAILRLKRLDDIALFGAYLREHDRHAGELAQLARANDPRREIPGEPPFLTRDALVVGALDGDEPVIEAMKRIEEERIARYERARRAVDGPTNMLRGLLERHLADARARLVALQRRSPATARVRGGIAA